jgi:hypothetical protein
MARIVVVDQPQANAGEVSPVEAVNGRIIWADIFGTRISWKNIGSSWCARKMSSDQWLVISSSRAKACPYY